MKSFIDKWNEGLCAKYYIGDSLPNNTAIYDELISYIPKTAEKILEIGAGSGYIVNKLKSQGREAIGTTICKTEADKYNLLIQDMHDLQFENETFDVVIARHVLEHALSPRLVIREVHRVLKLNGLFLVETPVTKDGLENSGNKTHFYSFSISQWELLFKHNGFNIEKKEISGSSFRLIMNKEKFNE